MDPAAHPSARRLTWRLYAATAGMGAIALVCAGLLIGVALAQERPSWWRPLDPADPAVGLLGREVQNAAVTLLHEPRPSATPATGEESGGYLISDPWTVAVTPEQANAWLNAYLPRWVANQAETFVWPEQVRLLEVDFSDDRLVVGVEIGETRSPGPSVSRSAPGQVLAATIAPRIDRDGALWVPAQWLHVGRLPLPAEWMIDGPLRGAKQRLPRSIRDLPETAAMFDAFAGRNPVMISPTLRLADGRRVRLLGMDVKDGRLVLTCRTEQRLTTPLAARSAPQGDPPGLDAAHSSPARGATGAEGVAPPPQ